MISDRDSMDGGRGLSRRSFLQLAAGGAVGVVGLEALASCTTANVTSTSGGGSVTLPAFVPAKIAKPDLPGNAQGVRNEYWQYPKDLVRSVEETPGRGGDVSALVIAYVPPPTPLAQNTYWQQFNKNLGVNFKPVVTAEADWNSKLATVMASNDLPDYILMYPYGQVPHELAFLQAQCQDLTEFLSGDAVKQYPNLANLPTQAWRSTTYNGRIYGLPQPRGAFGGNLFFHTNLADDAGIPWQPKNTDDFLRLMKAVTQPQKNVWGMGAVVNTNYNLDFFMQVFGAPNQWKAENGKFTHYLESDAAREAVAFARKVYQAGVYHPDANNMSTVQGKSGFYGTKFAAYYDGFSAYQGTWQSVKQVDPKFEPRVILPFGHDGGKGTYWLGIGSFAFTAIKKSSKDRVRELLRVANYLAAPFGTEESLFLAFGVKDVDYTADKDGNPVLNTRGKAEIALNQGYITSGPSIMYDAQYPDFIKAIHQQEAQLVPLGIPNPIVGLYSETYTEQYGTVLTTMLNPRLSGIISGKAPMSDFDQLVKDFRAQGGDQMKKEFAQAQESAAKKR